MGTLFRSEPMAMCQLFLQSDAAYQCVAELGDLGLVQLIDLNADVNAFQRKFVNDVRRCEEMQRSLNYIEREITKEKLHVVPEDPQAPMALPRDMIDMEAMYGKIEEELRQVNDNVEDMNKNYVQLVEVKHVLRSAGDFFETHREMGESMENINNQNGGTDLADKIPTETPTDPGVTAAPKQEHDTLGFVAGMIPVERFQSFERMLWRVGRGTIFVRQMFVDEPIVDVHGESQRKCVFLVFFPGKQLRSRVCKICDAFKASIYPCPASAEERREAAIKVLQQLEDMRKVFHGSQDHRMKLLANAARKIRTWKVQVTKMKAVFHVMNMLNVDVTQKCLIAECWIPDRDMAKVQAALRRGTEAAGSSFPCIINRVENEQAPPTFNRTSAFSSGFQALIDAYGVGNYLEVNPAPYAIITFPFLFAVMFGDAGHGLLMTLLAAALIYYEKPLSRVREEMTTMIYGGRYLILLMGLFSIYTGLIYNDVFSKSLAVFRSNWILRDVYHEKAPQIGLLPESDYANQSYPFGLDPIWMIASNKIQFTNSYKMKMAVIVGVLHMTFGTVLSLWNYTFFKDRTGFPAPRTPIEAFLRRNLNIWTVFIPELMFLLSLFGYLVFMILYKWMLPFGAGHGEGPSCSRSILIMFINMVMQFGSVGDTPKSLCYQRPMFPGQSTVQLAILLVALVAVPWLLLAKPLYLIYLNWVHSQQLPPDHVPIVFHEHEMGADVDEGQSEASSSSSRRRKSAVSLHTLRAENVPGDDLDAAASEEQAPDRPYEFDVGEVFIHQIIHTIEYCLGAVSNTASYLRLWALSLAHAQLSEVLWSMIFKGAVFSQEDDSVKTHVTSSVMIAATWAVWAVLTICILLLMEGLSAFLHALRLHWVEFMNKFFKGEGYAFAPFNFREVVRNMEDQDA